MMAELRGFKKVHDKLGTNIRAEWIPSVIKQYPYALSRHSQGHDLQVLLKLRRSGTAGMGAPGDVFLFRQLEEPPFIQRRLVLLEMAQTWTQDETLVLCPPPNLIIAILKQLEISGAPALCFSPRTAHISRVCKRSQLILSHEHSRIE